MHLLPLHQGQQWESSIQVLCGLDVMRHKTFWTCIQSLSDHWRKWSWWVWWDPGWGRSGCQWRNFWPSRQAWREESNHVLKRRRKNTPYRLYPQPSAQDICTHHSWSMHGHVANICRWCWAGKLRSGLRPRCELVHGDAIDDQRPMLIIKVFNGEVSESHTHLPMYLMNVSSFDRWLFKALYWASCFPSLSSVFLACRSLTASNKTCRL